MYLVVHFGSTVRHIFVLLLDECLCRISLYSFLCRLDIYTDICSVTLSIFKYKKVVLYILEGLFITHQHIDVLRVLFRWQFFVSFLLLNRFIDTARQKFRISLFYCLKIHVSRNAYTHFCSILKVSLYTTFFKIKYICVFDFQMLARCFIWISASHNFRIPLFLCLKNHTFRLLTTLYIQKISINQ